LKRIKEVDGRSSLKRIEEVDGRGLEKFIEESHWKMIKEVH